MPTRPMQAGPAVPKKPVSRSRRADNITTDEDDGESVPPPRIASSHSRGLREGDCRELVRAPMESLGDAPPVLFTHVWSVCVIVTGYPESDSTIAKPIA